MIVPTTINNIIAIIKYCIASGETVSARMEKGLLLNIYAFSYFFELIFVVLYIVELIVQPQTLVNLSLITGYFFLS